MTGQHGIENTDFSTYTNTEALESIKGTNKAEIKKLAAKIGALEKANKRINARIFTIKNSQVFHVPSPIKPINERK